MHILKAKSKRDTVLRVSSKLKLQHNSRERNKKKNIAHIFLLPKFNRLNTKLSTQFIFIGLEIFVGFPIL